MILSAFTVFHVLLSLIGIGTGLLVVYGMLVGNRYPGWTQIFLATTMATSVTGFFFPFHGVTPGIVVGVISVLVLALAYYALRSRKLAGGWAKTYVIASVFALYLNVFVLVVQLFEKVPALEALAPTQSEGPFKAAQLLVLVAFGAAGFLATKRAARY